MAGHHDEGGVNGSGRVLEFLSECGEPPVLAVEIGDDASRSSATGVFGCVGESYDQLRNMTVRASRLIRHHGGCGRLDTISGDGQPLHVGRDARDRENDSRSERRGAHLGMGATGTLPQTKIRIVVGARPIQRPQQRGAKVGVDRDDGSTRAGAQR